MFTVDRLLPWLLLLWPHYGQTNRQFDRTSLYVWPAVFGLLSCDQLNHVIAVDVAANRIHPYSYAILVIIFMAYFGLLVSMLEALLGALARK